LDDNINHSYITKYLRSILPPRGEILTSIEESACLEESYVPIIEPEVAQLLRLFIAITKPERILEIGTAVGYSAIFMAQCAEDIKITTIERYKNASERAKINIEKAGLSSRIEIIEGDAAEVLLNLSGEYDIIFLDAAKGQYPVFLPYIENLLREGGILISDNVLYKGMTASRELVIRRKITIVKRLRQYLKTLMEHKAFTTSIIPIGDGVAVSYKR
jgi:predicted O-methyltransferase YrrM